MCLLCLHSAHVALCSSFFMNAPSTAQVSTLSYTTLFRSPVLNPKSADHTCPLLSVYDDPPTFTRIGLRSEDHTAELQSLTKPVCRLPVEHTVAGLGALARAL